MIRLFQRHCNFSTNSHNKPRPEWFDREKIFDSLVLSLDERVEFTAFHDSGNGSIEDHFLKNKNINKISQKGGNDAQSFLNLLNYVLEQNYNDEDIIYFLEDDYIHRAGWIDIMLEGFKYIGVDYITLYDCSDKYWLPMYDQLQSKIIVTPSSHWRTTPSTTNTYAMLASTFKKHYNIHKEYCDLEKGYTRDHDKFLRLWNEGSNLISCLPGYSTHCETEYLSPCINWKNI
jgi:hypothetical protein